MDIPSTPPPSTSSSSSSSSSSFSSPSSTFMTPLHSEYEARLQSPTKQNYNSPSPRSSPKKDYVSDRFIPTRTGHDFSLLFDMPPGPEQRSPSGVKTPAEDNSVTYNNLLRSEIIESPPNNIFRYKTRRATPRTNTYSPYKLSPLSPNAHKLLSAPRKCVRKISKHPYKILEVPRIQDDFYLNLVDWSSQNILAVGSSSRVYLWNASISQVTKLCEIGTPDSITSVSWIQRGTHLAIGTHKGLVQIWDVAKGQKVRDLSGHRSRIGALAWNGNTITSGSRDRKIYHRDVNDPACFTQKLTAHTQEVCGLKWSPDNQHLASGGNDNKLLVWDLATCTNPIYRFTDHSAAVKAITWSPHQRGLLASGGGTADRCIRFWNTLNGSLLNCMDTGSQVCNLAWSKNVNELVSTHGYSQNQIVVWNYPSMSQVATLIGHTMRVLYLAVSPDGQSVVTGAGDDTLRFWNVFPTAKDQAHSTIVSTLYTRNDIR